MYHGSTKKFNIGFKLLPRNEYTANETSKELESLFENQRPKNCISRKKAVFLSDDLDLIDASGGYTDIIYEVQGDKIEKSDLAWYSEGQRYLDEGNIDLAKTCAKKYWSGEKFYNQDQSCFEYRANSAIIKSIVEINVPEEELENHKEKIKFKKRDYIPDNLKDIVLENIEKAAEKYGITYDIVSVSIYGSTLKNKKKPNDIDIFVHLENLNSEYVEFEPDLEDEYNSENEQFQILLSELMHESLHHELQPPNINKKPLDIAIKTYEYDYIDPILNLDSFIKINNKKKNKRTKKKKP